MTDIAFLGLGEMGSALARAAVGAGFPCTIWNRSRDKAAPLENQAWIADSPAEAIAGADLVVMCLFDAASVLDVLEPVGPLLQGKALINVTTTSPDGARELSRWAQGHGARYLDGGIMAVPAMIGTPATSVLYSGSEAVFDEHRKLLESWGRAEYFGDDPGMASLYDLALLAGMYVMFAGFFHGAAMVGAAGVPAAEFAQRATPWLQAMATAFGDYATVIDSGEYGRPGQQSLEFSDLTDILDASRSQGVRTELIDAVQKMIHRQIDAGHGKDGFARVIESVRA
jgi:3-hydroxyisobutyrate dehydrogenase-like beta-hydroxyacid dehydrogenase